MRRSATVRLLLIVAALLLGVGSAVQLWRYPARLHAALEMRNYLALTFSPDCKTFATVEARANGSNTIRLADLATCQERILGANLEGLQLFWFSPDGSFLAASDGTAAVTLWNVSDGKMRRLVPEDVKPRSKVLSIAFSPDCKLLSVELSNTPNRIRLLDTETGKQPAGFEGFLLTTFAFAPGSKEIAYAKEIPRRLCPGVG